MCSLKNHNRSLEKEVNICSSRRPEKFAQRPTLVGPLHTDTPPYAYGCYRFRHQLYSFRYFSLRGSWFRYFSLRCFRFRFFGFRIYSFRYFGFGFLTCNLVHRLGKSLSLGATWVRLLIFFSLSSLGAGNGLHRRQQITSCTFISQNAARRNQIFARIRPGVCVCRLYMCRKWNPQQRMPFGGICPSAYEAKKSNYQTSLRLM